MEHFTPIASLVGGILIGLAATLLMALNGRVAGISGITAGLLPVYDRADDWAWRLAFVGGLVVAPVLLMAGGRTVPAVEFVAPAPVMAVAGLLVGFGSVLGNGCTSGHGVCGIAQLSLNSIIATVAFTVSGALTVYVVRHVVGG